jgi:transposase-like protein
MAKKITSEIIQQMLELYEELGTYSAVAKKLGVSATTVSKYIKEQNSFKTYSTYSGPTPEENPPEKELIVGFSFLSQAELNSYNDFLKEYGL